MRVHRRCRPLGIGDRDSTPRGAPRARRGAANGAPGRRRTGRPSSPHSWQRSRRLRQPRPLRSTGPLPTNRVAVFEGLVVFDCELLRKQRKQRPLLSTGATADRAPQPGWSGFNAHPFVGRRRRRGLRQLPPRFPRQGRPGSARPGRPAGFLDHKLFPKPEGPAKGRCSTADRHVSFITIGNKAGHTASDVCVACRRGGVCTHTPSQVCA